ncbi:MAG: hypothetical protein LC627_05930 [Verrucomicrobiaceae bacterium]|nr:hypothetical protein [Verrucomicrobiaceae bacterium]
MSILRRNRLRQRGSKPLIFLAGLFHGATGHEVLKFFVSAETQHLFAAAGRIPGSEILVHDIEELFEFEGGTSGEHRHQLLGDKIGDSTGECIFLENSHRARIISPFFP